MRKFKKLLALLMAVVMGLSFGPVSAAKADEPTAVSDTAYLMYASTGWTYQYWGGEAENGVVATNAEVTGNGQYTVGLDFTGTPDGNAAGIEFTALGLINGESTFPGCYLTIDSIEINGEAVTFKKGYTSSDDGITTRSNIYNTWVSALPADARAVGGVADATWSVVDASLFEAVETISVTFTLLEQGKDTAYLMYMGDNYSYWGGEAENGVVATNAEVTGSGTYSVGLDFTGTPDGKAYNMAFSALGLTQGSATFPGGYLEVKSVEVNGEALPLSKGYTTSDNGIELRCNIYNEWVTELPAGAVARAIGGLEDVTWMMVDKAAFAEVETVKVTFEMVKLGEDTATLMYADGSWGTSYWGGTAENGIVATNATVTGTGSYRVGLDFTGTESGSAAGIAFAGVVLGKGSYTFPDAYIKINTITVNGEAIEIGKNYTNSDDKIELRSNVYNSGVTAFPEDARVVGGNLADATWMIVDPASFETVETVYVDFEVIAKGDDTAFLMYSSSNGAEYWGGEAGNGVVATNTVVDGEGEYTVALDFTGTPDGAAADLSFAALGLTYGELTFPNSYLEITGITVNGEEVAFEKGYTSSDDGIATRSNIYNAWVSKLPDDARVETGDVAESTWLMVDPAAFAGAQTVSVKFRLVKGAEASASADEGEAEEIVYSGDYHAYMGVQTNSSLWIFRNSYDDATYGYGTEQFEGLYSTSSETIYDATFTDATINGNGTYTVKLENPDFQDEESMSLLFVSTDLPMSDRLVVTDLITKVNGRTQYEAEEAVLDPDSKEYLKILVLNIWNNKVKDTIEPEFPIESIEITFTISGLEGDTTGGAGGADEAGDESGAAVTYSGEYNAFMGIQSNTTLWIFRNAYDDATYGFGTDQFKGLYSTTGETMYDGVFTDAKITGDGTYTVKLDGPDFQEEETLSQLFVSTDIPMSDSLKVTDLVTKINGRTQYEAEEAVIDADSKVYLRFMILNIWNSAVKATIEPDFPIESIEITFTLSGLGYSAEVEEPEPTATPTLAPTEAAATPTQAAAAPTAATPASSDKTEDGSNTTMVIIIVVVAVVIAAGAIAVVMISKKKKGGSNE